MFQVNIFPFWVWVFICCTTCNRKYWLWWSTWLPDEERWSKIFKGKQKWHCCLMEIFPLPQQLYSWSLVTYHTTLLVVQEEAISLLLGGHVSLHLFVARACGPLLSSLHCPERIDPNHKEAKTVSLMLEHGEVYSLESPWTFHLYSGNSWRSIFNIKVVISSECLLKAIETFVLILPDVFSSVLKCDYTAWDWVLCLNKKVFIPGEVLFMSSSRKNGTPIW